MNTIEVEKANLNLTNLSLLESKVVANEANESDYQTLEVYLSNLGVPKNYLLDLLRDKGILSYTQYIIERKNKSESQNRDANGLLLGNILGAIKALKDYAKINNL